MSNYRTVKAVAALARDKWGIEMDHWTIASNCKRVMKDERVVPLLKKLSVHTVADFNVNLGNDINKILAVILLDQPRLLTTGTIRLGEIEFPEQIFWVSDDSNQEITSDELTQLNALPYFRGPYVDYVWDKPHMKFNFNDIVVGIVYSCIATDENNLVLIPDEMVDALANYVAEVHLKPLFLLGKVPMGIYKEVQNEVNESFGNGRWNMLMNDLSQNELNSVMNTMTSMDRKAYNVNI